MSEAAADRPSWGLTAVAFAVVAFLQLPVIVVVLAAVGITGLFRAHAGQVSAQPRNILRRGIGQANGTAS